MKSKSLHPFDLLLEIDQRSRGRADAEMETTQATGIVGRLALQLGAWNLLLLMQDITEIIPVPQVSRVPGVKPWLLGIANLRGTVISIIDLHQYLGGKPSTITPSSRVVVVSSGEWEYGLLINGVIGMRHFGPENRVPNFDTIDAKLRPFLAEAFNGEGKVWLAFSVNRLLNEPGFLNAAI